MKKKPWEYRRLVISACRLIFFRSPLRRQVVKRCTIAKGHYLCEVCLNPVDKIQVDHIKPIGIAKDWNEFFDFLFCDIKDLQGICKPCHNSKTKLDRKTITKTKQENKNARGKNNRL